MMLSLPENKCQKRLLLVMVLLATFWISMLSVSTYQSGLYSTLLTAAGIGDEAEQESCDFSHPNTAAAALVRLVQTLTNLKDKKIIRLLNCSLSAEKNDLRPMLRDLRRFAGRYRCATCRDSRPLPLTALSLNTRLQHNQTWRGYPLPIIAVRPTGRLGNAMGEYASAYALHRLYNTTVLLTKQHVAAFKGYFPGLSLPVVEVAKKNDWVALGRNNRDTLFEYAALELGAAGLLGAHRFLISDYPFEKQLFNAYREDIRREFTFSDSLLQKTNTILTNISETMDGPSPPTFVGVHVRLTDYSRHMRSLFGVNITYTEYLKRAVQYYKDRAQDPVFIVTSDNLKFVDKFFNQLGETFFSFQGSPGEDMCLLTHCNHSIITFGTFGFWTGYLAPGTTVYPDVPFKKPYPHSRPFYERARVSDFVSLPLLDNDQSFVSLAILEND